MYSFSWVFFINQFVGPTDIAHTHKTRAEYKPINESHVVPPEMSILIFDIKYVRW